MEMRGKTVLVTGSTDGVGRYVAGELAKQGARVLIHGRDAARANALIDEIKAKDKVKVLHRCSIRQTCRRSPACGNWPMR